MKNCIPLAAGLLAVLALPLAATAQTATDPTATAPAATDQKPVVRLLTPAREQDATELAKKLQNPIGDLYSFPFQGNTNFNTGTKGGTQEVLNVQPVIPIHINDGSQPDHPHYPALVWQPTYQPAHTVPFGTAPTRFLALLSNANPVDHFVFGAGPIIRCRSPATGPSAPMSGAAGRRPWRFISRDPGSPACWSTTSGRSAEPPGAAARNTASSSIEPFVNYNFGEGWYAFTAPEFTANWPAAGNNAWTVPFGGGGGKVVKLFGKVPVNFQLGTFYNAIRPSYTGAWSLRTQITLIF